MDVMRKQLDDLISELISQSEGAKSIALKHGTTMSLLERTPVEVAAAYSAKCAENYTLDEVVSKLQNIIFFKEEGDEGSLASVSYKVDDIDDIDDIDEIYYIDDIDDIDEIDDIYYAVPLPYKTGTWIVTMDTKEIVGIKLTTTTQVKVGEGYIINFFDESYFMEVESVEVLEDPECWLHSLYKVKLKTKELES